MLKNIPYCYKKTIAVLLLCLTGIPLHTYSQFILNGNATLMGGNCYQLTADLNSQSGQIWNTNTYDLTQPFDIQFNLFLGCKNYTVGADGIGFVFQQLSVNAGSPGGGMGFGGIVPSVAVEFDNYQNGWDPAFCHVAIEKNGDVDHSTANLLAGPAQLSPTASPLPDCTSHPARITWDPATQTLKVYFDCSLRVSYTGDIINTVFGGNPNVYWGFTAATGGASNTQQVCMVNTPLNNLQDTAVCKGTSVPLAVFGGVTYSWSPAAGLSSSTISNPVATPLVTTDYTVTITDGCGIQKKDSINITVYDPPVSANNAVICTGNTAVLNATGAVSYAWSPGTGLSATIGSSVTASPSSTTIYSITGTDVHGCSSTSMATVVVNTPFPVNTTQTNVTCNGASDGTATATPAGGTAPYTYSWSTTPVQTTATATGLVPGTYTVTVTDSPPCVPSGVELVPNGDFSSGNTGFSSSYSYTPPPNTVEGQYWVATAAQLPSWNGGMFSNGDHTSGAGNMLLVNGSGTPGSNVWCQTITVNPNTTYLFSSWVSSLNNSSPAILQFSVNGVPLGTPFNAPASANIWSQFFASWSSGASTSANICILNQNTSIGGNDFGIDDISFQECLATPSCPSTATVTITEPLPLSGTTVQTNVSCNSGSDGTATVTPAGGTSAYTYSWNSVPVQTTATANNLSMGTYVATITDANNCTTTASVTLTEPTALVLSTNGTQSICAGQSATISASAIGGTGAYTILWANAPIPAQASQSVSPAATTTYSVGVSDANGCTDIDSAIIIVNPLPVPIAGSNSAICENQALNLTSSIPSGNSWSGPNFFSSASQNPSVPNATLAAAGVYTLTVTDANTCVGTTTTTVAVNPVPVLSAVTDQTLCANANTTAINYVSNPAGATVNWTNSDPTIGIGAGASGNIASFTALNAGTTALTGNFSATPVLTGCTGSPITFSITVKPLPVLSPVASQTLCTGASTAAVNYVTNPAGANVGWTNSNGAIGAATSGVGNIPAFTTTNSTTSTISGNFTAIPVLNGCTGATETFAITVDPAVSVGPVANITLCDNATVPASAFAVTPAASAISWTNNDPTIGLAANGTGDYASFTATNSSGAAVTATVTVSASLNNCNSLPVNYTITVKPVPVLNPVSSDTLCPGASSTAVNYVSNPAGAITGWTNSNANIGTPVSGSGDILSFTATNTTTSPILGNFTATPVLNGCTGAAITFTITVNPPVYVNPIANITICNNAPVPASAFTSIPPGATFNWNNSNTTIGLAGNGTGNYPSFTATNTAVTPVTATVGVGATLNGCNSSVVNYTITVNPTPPAPLVANPVYCLNNPAVQLTAIPSTGLQWYTNAALTNPSPVAPTPSTAVAGTIAYYVTQTISNCISPSSQIQVLVNPLPVIAINPPVATGCSPVCITFSNPASTGNCFWNMGDGTVVTGNCTPTNCYVTPGNYTTSLTITDANSCVNSGTAQVVVYPNPVADFNAGPQPTTILEPEITFADASWQATIGSWSWSFGDAAGGISSFQNPVYTYADTGTYIVQLDVVSNFGCTATAIKNITILDETLIYVPNAFSPNNDKLNDTFLPKGTGLKDYQLYVFDRWGNKIFHSSELEKGWDGTVAGTAALEDVYVWRIEAKDMFGDKKQLHGRVTLVR